MIELKIEGMTCGHCEGAVKRALASVPGVEQVLEVNRQRGIARLEGTPDVQALIDAVEEEGYKASRA